MIDNKIIYQIIEKLHETFLIPIMICDVSGRVIASTESCYIGEMNLLAIEALNINSKVTSFPDFHLQKSGAAMPLFFSKKRLGAVVIEHSNSSDIHTIELLSKTIELLYEELILSQKKQSRSHEYNQFLFEWLHLQSDYTENFIKHGELLGIDITGKQTIILIERTLNNLFTSNSILQKLLDKQDILLPLSENQNLLILKENDHFERKYHRIISACADCHMGICSEKNHLNSAYLAVQESLELGKLLFPNETIHEFEKMKLAIALSKTTIPGLETAFARLTEVGQTAHLAETAVIYIRQNGDIQKVCEQLHIHRNSIPYRLRRIQEICGLNLMNYYDLLHLYVSYICYMKKQI